MVFDGLKIKDGVNFLIFIGIFLALLTMVVSAEISINGPSSVLRGNESFEIKINETSQPTEPYYFGLVISPQVMTGDIGDRPPFIVQNSYTNFSLNSWNAYYIPVQDKNEQFWEIVPNGITYPSNSTCWIVPWGGTHYMTELDPNKWYEPTPGNWMYPLTIGLNYGDYYPTVKTGEYKFHIQKSSAQSLTSAKPKIDYSDYKVQISPGELSLRLLNYYKFHQDPQEIEEIQEVSRGQRVHLNGTNTDSNATYLWLMGEGLPKCGSKLDVLSLPMKSNEPTKVEVFKQNWDYDWDIPNTVISQGKYTIYASSVNPEEILKEFYNRPSECGSPCKSIEKGLCALQDCSVCGAIIQKKDIIITDLPAEINRIGKIEPCCCPGYPCGYTSSLVNINMSGIFGDSRTPMQIWMFGNNQIYDRNYLFNDSFKTFLDKDGSFQLDIYEYLLKPNDLNLCDLDNGEYYLLVQLPGQTNITRQRFDITVENSTEYWRIKNIESSVILPKNITKDSLFVVKADPIYWSRAFPIEGPGAYAGKKAMDALVSELSQSWVEDRFITTSFFLEPIRCKQDSVSFTANQLEGNVPLTVQFFDNSTFNGTGFLWDFGDGTTSNERNPNHVYNKTGIFDVTFTVNGTGTDGKEKNPLRKYNYIIVKEISPQFYDPVADFTYAKLDNEPLTIRFIDQSYGSTPLTYLWSFGNNSMSTEKSPQHTFPSVGKYAVNLTVTDQYAKSNWTSRVVPVPPMNSPVANFEYNLNSVNPLQVQFNDLSLGDISSWQWSFGDGTGSSTQSPTHLYNDYGSYDVTLTAGNRLGSNSITLKLNIDNPLVTAGFKWTNIGNRTVRFTDTSQGKISNWTLEFGDGNIQNFVQNWNVYDHKYSQLGNYYAKLTVENEYNKDTYSNQIMLYRNDGSNPI